MTPQGNVGVAESVTIKTTLRPTRAPLGPGRISLIMVSSSEYKPLGAVIVRASRFGRERRGGVMGASLGREEVETVCIDSLRQIVDSKLERKYRQGMAGVLAALTPSFSILVESQRIAQEIGASASTTLSDIREGKVAKDAARETALSGCRALVALPTSVWCAMTAQSLGRWRLASGAGK